VAAKFDFKKDRKPFFTASAKEFEQVTLPSARYLMIDGQGAPGSAAYSEALGLLYPAAYNLKFLSKLDLGRDYGVPALQGLWSAEDMGAYTAGRRDEWRWTMMLMVPHWIGPAEFAEAIRRAGAKKKGLDFSRVRLDDLDEGLCLQKIHIGSYADEAPVLHRLHHELMPALGLAFNGLHHEIYLNDPNKTAPDKLRTILRQPVKPL
jgi:hypothetical protein